MRPLLLTVLLVAAPLALSSASAGVTEVPLPSTFRAPLTPLVDANGVVWFTLDGSWAIGRHDAAGATTAVSLGERASDTDTLYGIARDFTGAIWTAGQERAYMVSGGVADSRPLPARTDPTGGAHVGLDGSVWLALTGADKVARYLPATDAPSLVATPAGFGPIEMTHDDAGILYVSGTYGHTYGRIDPARGDFELGPAGIAQSPTGIEWHDGALWMGEHGASAIVKVALDTEVVTRYPTSASPYYPISGPSGLVVTPEGIVWFAEHFADRIARLDPVNLTLVEYELPSSPGTNTQQIALAPDGKVWFAEWSKDRLGHAQAGGETPSFRAPAGVFVDAKGTVLRTPIANASATLAAASPHAALVARIDGGDLVIETSGVPAGLHYVLLSEKAGDKTWVGRFVEVRVQDETPGPQGVVVLATLGALALALGRRRRA